MTTKYKNNFAATLTKKNNFKLGVQFKEKIEIKNKKLGRLRYTKPNFVLNSIASN
jgi:hypothetical protein